MKTQEQEFLELQSVSAKNAYRLDNKLTIQWLRGGCKWEDDVNPDFNLYPSLTYRIKPQPTPTTMTRYIELHEIQREELEAFLKWSTPSPITFAWNDYTQRIRCYVDMPGDQAEIKIVRNGITFI